MYLVKNYMTEKNDNENKIQKITHTYIFEREEINDRDFIKEIQKFRDREIEFFFGDPKLKAISDSYEILSDFGKLEISYTYQY